MLALVTGVFSVGGLAGSWQIVTEPFPPYFAPQLPQQGWLWQMTHAALKTQGVEASLEFTSWPRAMRLTASGQRTAILGAFYSEARERDYLYSQPIASATSGFFRHKANSEISFEGDLSSLEPFRISVAELDLVSESLRKQPGLQVSETDQLVTSLHLLLRGRVDFVAGTREVGFYWLEHDIRLSKLAQASTIEFIGPALSSNALYLAFPRKDKAAMQWKAVFEQGIRHLHDSGELHTILKQHHFNDGQIAQYVQTIGLK